MRPPDIRCFGLSKQFGDITAVHQVDLAVDHGQKLVLLGPSGCGKTTLLRLIAGFELPDAGTLAVGGQLVSGPSYLLPPEKRRVGMVFQDYALFPHLDVLGNVSYGLRKSKDRINRVEEVLALVGLEGMESRMTHELSGGEQQRVALARALAPRPAVVLLDEPFSNLDAGLRAAVRTEVRQILTDAGATSIFVTHDQEEALVLGDQIAIMNRGHIEQVGSPEDIFHQPITTFVAEFMGVADFLNATISGNILVTELGALPLPTGVHSHDSIKIMVRPDDVGIFPDHSGQCQVVDRIFQGAHYLYRVLTPSGSVIHSLEKHHQTYEDGTLVNIRLVAEHPLMCFINNQAKQIPSKVL